MCRKILLKALFSIFSILTLSCGGSGETYWFCSSYENASDCETDGCFWTTSGSCESSWTASCNATSRQMSCSNVNTCYWENKTCKDKPLTCGGYNNSGPSKRKLCNEETGCVWSSETDVGTCVSTEFGAGTAGCHNITSIASCAKIYDCRWYNNACTAY